MVYLDLLRQHPDVAVFNAELIVAGTVPTGRGPVKMAIMAGRGTIWELLGRSALWEDVVRHAPKIVEAARVLYETNRRRQQRPADAADAGSSPGPDPAAGPKNRLADVEVEVRRLQENETQQAALVTDIAKQLEALTRSVDTLAVRMQIFLWLVGGALTVGLVALALSLVR